MRAGRHIYAAITGFLLLYYPFGNGVFHLFVPSLLTYLAMHQIQEYSATLSWVISFAYLIAWCARRHACIAALRCKRQGIRGIRNHMQLEACMHLLACKRVHLRMCAVKGRGVGVGGLSKTVHACCTQPCGERKRCKVAGGEC